MTTEPNPVSATIRESEDCWDIEVRFDDGQKFTAVEVDKDHPQLAHRIADMINEGPDHGEK